MDLYVYNNTNGVGRVARHLWAATFTSCVERVVTSGVAAVNLFHRRETLLVKVRRCWLEWDRGTSTSSSLDDTVLVFLLTTCGFILSLSRCGTCCTWALWSTTREATSRRCSRESRGVGGWSLPSISRNARLSTVFSLCRWVGAADIHDSVAYSR